MSGIKLNDDLLPKEKINLLRREMYKKLFLCLLLTNSVTFILCTNGDQGIIVQKKEHLLKQDHSLFRISLQNNVSFPPGTEKQEASLFINRKVYLEKVILHKPKELNSQDTLKYEIEVPKQQTHLLVKAKGKIISAYPYSDYSKLMNLKKDSYVEIKF